jgi:Ca2+-binding RTX toxin-like protein
VARRKRNSRGRLGLFAGAAVAALLAFPGVASATVTSTVNAAGALTVTTDAGDAVTITSDANGDVKVNGANPGGGAAVAASSITSIQVTGDGGNNIIDLSGVSDPVFGVQTPVTVDGGGGNDTITGSKLADLLKGGGGHDRITGDDNPLGTQDVSRGDAGDDTMVWNGGDDDDINEGGDGNDTTEVNGGGGPEDFEVGPSPVAGRVLFQRTGPTPPGPFDIDIGTTENLRLNAGGGNDEIKGKKGLAGLIASTFNGDEGNDRIKGTDGEDLLSGGKGFDIIRSRDKAADQVEGDGGFDIAFVDKRDTVRGVEIVLGGALKVKVSAKSVNVAGGVAALTFRCVATKGCSGLALLRHDGKKIAGAKFKMGKKKTQTVRLKLNKRGLRLLAKAPKKGLKVQLRIDAKDAAKNGWRTDSPLKLKR